MSLPFFYIEDIDAGANTHVLDEGNSRHVVSVLRMQEGEQLQLADGKGSLLTAVITDPHKKKCRVAITGTQYTAQPAAKTGIGISLVKNPVRFEWFLEKATEIGVTEIIPLLCSRTENQHFRYGRMKNVLVSALLQSRQTWLPVLHEPVKFDAVLEQAAFQQKFIAHCLEEEKKSLGAALIDTSLNQLVLVGPEGDFTPGEIDLALQKGFIPVALGGTRLRTETAGVVAAVLLKNTR
ncbi:MAG: 16S rRNA (uracil(1498)-N(3))-methyltransferase [Chitinophagaceae bacterium]